MQKFIFIVILTLILTLSSTAQDHPIIVPTVVANEQITYTCTKICDGDTIVLNVCGQLRKIRLYGIDCPEHDQELGPEATKTTVDFLLNKEVQLKLKQKNPDLYGRLIGEVYILGVNYNQILLKKGLAVVYMTKDRAYLACQASAKVDKIGIWHLTNFIMPCEWRKMKKK
jgi:endonuclease YncB( thermonuclease family)